MNVEPHKKNARAAKDAPKADDGGIYFTPELIARVATFAEAVVRRGPRGHERASDVENICHAVGPMTSRIIKQYYLKKNMGYLEAVIQVFYDIIGGVEWARECHLAWMSVNTGWRRLVTDQLMQRSEIFRPRPMRFHPLLAMLNPVVAIEMDLLVALKFLVEVKDVDINTKRWIGLDQESSFPRHLVATAIVVDSFDAFQYLMSVDAIDIYSSRFISHCSETIFIYAIDSYIKDENKKRFFEAFVEHAKFRPNGRFFASGVSTVTCLHILLQLLQRQNRMVALERILDAARYLLDAGADPELEFHDLQSPLEIANNFRATIITPRDAYWWADAFSEIIRIMSEHQNTS